VITEIFFYIVLTCQPNQLCVQPVYKVTAPTEELCNSLRDILAQDLSYRYIVTKCETQETDEKE
jgi:hypothetical protein